MKRSFKSTFVAGLFICLPLLVTVWTIQFVFLRVEASLTPLVLETIHFLGLGRWLQAAWVDYVAPLVSVSLGIFSIWVIGVIGSNVLGKKGLQLLEKLVLKVPLVRTIYGSTRQFIEAFSPGAGRSFSRVVLAEYPRPGVWTLGLVTSQGHAEVDRATGQSLTSVFLPTTPNPTSGWLAFIPADKLITVKMSVDDAFKLIVSGGVLSGPQQGPHA